VVSFYEIWLKDTDLDVGMGRTVMVANENELYNSIFEKIHGVKT